ncbi:MAG TPA: hypothetical protein VLE97_11385 [Gaiellaceae bacterium]|nr:hypothetical protein [Gaiellaceae bacterium]
MMCEHGRDDPALCPHCLGINSIVDLGDHELGDGVAVRWDSDGRGLAWKHPACRAWATLRFAPDPASTGHTLLRGGPADTARLTIGGSLLCPMGCGTHGVVENGRWRPV